VKFPIGPDDRIPRAWLKGKAMDINKAAEIVYAGAPGNLEAPVLTPLPTAEVLHLRVENKQRTLARLAREIAEKEQRVSDLAHEIWLLKLEREGVQSHG